MISHDLARPAGLSLANAGLAVSRCFAGRPCSASRIRSMMPVKGSSFSRFGGWRRRYPGGTENDSIFATVRGSMPNRRAASRRLIPSI